MKVISVLTAAALVLSLGACQNNSRGTNETLGTLGGAAAGGLIGSQIGGGTGQLIAIGAGVLVGGLLGNEIGRQLDENDRYEAERAYQQAQTAPVGQTVTWNNPENGNSGTVTPTRDGYSDTGEYCREYQQTVVIGGKTESAFGVACRQADGTWRIVQ